MTRAAWLRVFVMGSVVTALATLPAAAQNKKPNPKDNKQADPPGMAALVNQYRGWFAVQDLNKDTYLDKEELAKSFRGLNARAYDYRPPAKTEPAKDAPKDKSSADDPPPVPKESDSTKELTPEQQSRLAAYYARFPDYQFLVQLDKDRDDKIHSSEFDAWARDQARAIADHQQQIEDSQKEILDLQKQLARTNLTAQQRSRYSGNLNNARNRQNNLQNRLRNLERQNERFRRNNNNR